MTILVVEDNQSVRSLLKLRLGKAGYTVYFAEDGRQGVEEASRVNPDLILIDYNLPEMFGDVAAKLILEEGYKGKIVGLTGSIEHERMLKAGCSSVISKPIDKKTFIPMIAELLNKGA